MREIEGRRGVERNVALDADATGGGVRGEGGPAQAARVRLVALASQPPSQCSDHGVLLVIRRAVKSGRRRSAGGGFGHRSEAGVLTAVERLEE
jgi:hypothetical protein